MVVIIAELGCTISRKQDKGEIAPVGVSKEYLNLFGGKLHIFLTSTSEIYERLGFSSGASFSEKKKLPEILKKDLI